MRKSKILFSPHHARTRAIAIAIAIALALVSAVAAADEFGGIGLSDAAEEEMDADTGKTAEVRGWVEPGLGLIDGTGDGVGQYTAPHSDGGYGFLNLDLYGATDGRTGDTSYWRLWGRDLGTGTGDLTAEAGDQGNYKLRFGFRQIERLDRDDATSVFSGGDNRLLLPTGYSDPSDVSDLSFYRSVDLGVKRKEFLLGLEKVLGPAWTLSSDLRVENKEGDKPTAVGQGFRGTAIGIQSIDYRHTQLDLLLRYGERGRQLEFGYYLSQFRNADRALNFENPVYSPRTGEPASAGSQQLALPPDNFFHQLRVSGGYQLSDTARVTAQAAYGRSTQDETFLPYSTADFYDYDAATGVQSTAPPYPRNSLEGRVDQSNLKVSLFNRLSSKLNTTLSYRYAERDNRTPLGVYRHLHYDGEAYEEWGNRVNSRARHTAALEAKLRLPKRMRLRAGVEHQRTLRETELLEPHAHHDDDTGDRDTVSSVTSRRHVTREEKLWTQLRVPVSSSLSGKLKLSASKRNTGSSRAFDIHIEEHDAVAPTYLLDRERFGIETSASWQARTDLLVSAAWRLFRDRFKNAAFGPDRALNRSGHLDLTFSPGPELSANLFMGIESSAVGQNSRGTGGDRGGAAVSDPWSVDVQDLGYHAGLGIDWKPAHERYDVRFDYSFLDSENAVSSKHASDGKSHLPDTESRLHRVSLQSSIPVRKQLTLTAGYEFQRYDSTNWGWQGSDYEVLGFGWDAPNESAHLLRLGARFEF